MREDPRAQDEEARATLEAERWQLLQQVIDLVELPMALLGLAWLVLMVVEFTRGLTPWLQTFTTFIWILFIADFLAQFLVAPRKGRYLRRQWLTAVSLAIPAVRVLRFARVWRALRAVRATRSLQLVRTIGSLNRGMRALGRSMERRGVGYVIALTLIVTFGGAAGMYVFERPPEGAGLQTYGTALWWTAMIMTTMGSDYWPRTPEGRLLTLLLAAYAFAMFGYVTATLATFFVGRDAEADDSELASARQVRELKAEIRALRTELQTARRE